MNAKAFGVRLRAATRSRLIARGLADETGSILPLVIFYAFLCLVLVLLVTAITSLYLERERLYAVADGAALAGAESYDLASVAVVDGHPRPALESPAVRAAVAEFVSTSVADGFDALTVERAGTVDGRSAVVRLSAVWHPPVVSVLVPAGIRIGVTSTARNVFW
ncbi:pilus assembly protein TadG-related protein [Humibacter antri]